MILSLSQKALIKSTNLVKWDLGGTLRQYKDLDKMHEGAANFQEIAMPHYALSNN